MRCLSPHPRYSIQVFEGREEVVVDARGYASTQVLTKPVIANFETSGLLDHEILVAAESFSFVGIPEGVNPLTKVSVFDTEVYCQQFPEERRDEMQVQIDERLRVLQASHPNQFTIVEQPSAEKPWPSYDEFSAEDVIKYQQVLGIAPQRIRLYEEENQNRDEVVFAMLVQDDPENAASRYPDLVDSLTEGEGALAGAGTDEQPKEAFEVAS